MHLRAKKVAAALAAVESFLAEEMHARGGLAVATAPAGGGISPWVLAGRLALMSARMGSAPRGPHTPHSK